MSTRTTAGRVRATYAFIKGHRRQFSVQALCRVLGVATSGYYAWLKQPLSRRAQEDARLLRLIRASFVASQGICGARRVFVDLREAGETCSKHRVARLMREHRLRALHGYRTRRWSVGKPAILIPNLLQRQFTVTKPNKAWVTDITYSHVARLALRRRGHGSLLAQNRRPGGAADDPPRTGARRRNDGRAAPAPTGTLIRSDQGTQFGSDAWRRFCRSHRLEPSMSRRGKCWDNAVAEAFFGSLKKERVKKQIYRTRALAEADIAEDIDTFYIRSHRRSYLGGVSPEQFEAAHKPCRQSVH